MSNAIADRFKVSNKNRSENKSPPTLEHTKFRHSNFVRYGEVQITVCRRTDDVFL